MGVEDDYYDYAEEPQAFAVEGFDEDSEYDYGDLLMEENEDEDQNPDYDTRGLFDDGEEGKQDDVGLLSAEDEEKDSMDLNSDKRKYHKEE